MFSSFRFRSSNISDAFCNISAECICLHSGAQNIPWKILTSTRASIFPPPSITLDGFLAKLVKLTVQEKFHQQFRDFFFVFVFHKEVKIATLTSAAAFPDSLRNFDTHHSGNHFAFRNIFHGKKENCNAPFLYQRNVEMHQQAKFNNKIAPKLAIPAAPVRSVPLFDEFSTEKILFPWKVREFSASHKHTTTRCGKCTQYFVSKLILKISRDRVCVCRWCWPHWPVGIGTTIRDRHATTASTGLGRLPDIVWSARKIERFIYKIRARKTWIGHICLGNGDFWPIDAVTLDQFLVFSF